MGQAIRSIRRMCSPDALVAVGPADAEGWRLDGKSHLFGTAEARDRRFFVAGGRRVAELSWPVLVASIKKAKIGRKSGNWPPISVIQIEAREADVDQQTMRNFTVEPQNAENGTPVADSTAWSPRNEADFATVLLELARAQRGFGFYAETDARRLPLADRAHRAFASELARAGVIEFAVEAKGFQLESTARPIETTGPLVELEEALRRHGIRKLRIDPTLTRTALVGFLDLLGRGQDRYPSPDHFARTLAARDTQGIRINGIEAPRTETRPKLSGTPPRASASLATTPGTGPGAAAQQRSPTSEKPRLEDAPLESPSGDDRGERLRARLIDLDATVEDEEYCSRVADIVSWAEELWKDGLADECYRSMLVLADHAVGHGGRTGIQARAASASFASLASGERLDHLIDRACCLADSGDTGVRAAQLLLQLGERSVPKMLDRLAEEEGSTSAGPLRSLILTQGEIALPHLISAIEGLDERRARIGIRLAGELQNPEILPALLKTLRIPDLSLRLETIRALSFLPGPESKEALTAALASDLEEIAAAASQAIAKTDGSDAVPALLDVLEASLHTTKTHLGRTLVELLGRLGDERSVPRLSAILERRPVLRRAHWHAIQIAAIDALAVLPTKEARRSIERAALHAPNPIRERARTRIASLDKRG